MLLARLSACLFALLVPAIANEWPSTAIAMAAQSVATRHYVSAGQHLTYRSYGSGPIVIVLAGGPGLNALYMAPLAQTIAADGYRAILLDQRGTGVSAPAGRDGRMLTQRGTVDDIEALRNVLHARQLTFVTHSFGGGMALAYAAVHPERVAKLILIGSVGTDLSTVGRFADILMTHLSVTQRAAYADAQRNDDGAKALDIQLLAEFDDRVKARALIATEPRPFIYPRVSDAVYSDFAKHYHVAEALRAVHAHVTFLTGADDAARAMEPDLRRAFPRATRYYIAKSGHWPWIENPTAFDRALATALAIR